MNAPHVTLLAKRELCELLRNNPGIKSVSELVKKFGPPAQTIIDRSGIKFDGDNLPRLDALPQLGHAFLIYHPSRYAQHISSNSVVCWSMV